MDRRVIEMQFYETYYFANVVNNLLCNRFAYLRSLNEFYGDDRFLAFIGPFPRHSAFHAFIEFVVDSLLFEELAEVDLDRMRQLDELNARYPLPGPSLRQLPIEAALKCHDIEHQSFEAWLREGGKTFETATQDDAHDYYEEMRREEPAELLVQRMVNEVFFVMFPNRGLMGAFNEMLADAVSSSSLAEIPEEYHPLFSRDGVLKRIALPAWVQRAVFHRDRGLCTLCQRDVTGLVSVGNTKNYDHIVPLARGGLNDVTNIQLLCDNCNSTKGHRSSDTSDKYESWY